MHFMISPRQTRVRSYSAQWKVSTESKCLAQCLVCISGLATRIRTEVSFKDAVKVCFRLAKKITSNPWVGIETVPR